MEQWKQIDWASDGYLVSDQGRIKIVKPGRESIITGYLSSNYPMVRIEGRQIFVHRIVADHWCDGPADYQCVNHLNGIKTDNRAINLEKTTYKRNNEHAIETGLKKFRGEEHPRAALTLEQVHEVYRLKKEGKRLHEVHKIFNINYGTLKCIFNGSNWRFEYEKFFGTTFKLTGSRSGEVCGRSIPKEKVIQVYTMKKEGKRIFEIARELNLHFHTVKNIFHGKNWKHLYKEHFN